MKYILYLSLLAFTTIVLAEENNIIELSLTLDTNSQTKESIINGNNVINKLIKNKSFPETPSFKQDYSTYYIPKKEIYVLGSKLISYELEEMGRYIGCCVNEGNAALLRENNNAKKIEAFAKKNKCQIRRWTTYTPSKLIKLLNISKNNQDKIIHISCKANYRFRNK